MQITNLVGCDTSKGLKAAYYKEIKPPLVVEHAFPLTGFVTSIGTVTYTALPWKPAFIAAKRLQ